MTGGESAERFIAVAHGDYAVLAKLERAVPDARKLVDVMRGHEFDAQLLSDQRRGALLDAMDEVLSPNSSRKGTLILSWTGHAEQGPDGRLRLMGRTTDLADNEVAVAAKLGEWAARTGASQILVILDCCFSGGGVPDALAMASAVLAGRADVTNAWFGCIAASRGDESARSGALSNELTRLLEHGPTDDLLRQTWALCQERIPGDRLIDALVKEWSEPRQSPQQAATGNALPMLPNPLYRPTARNAVVEHLLQAARGTSTEGNYFTGRAEILKRIVGWVAEQNPGLCLVTGPAGSGKSAVVGRIVSLSVPSERAQLLRGTLPDELDPGESSVDANVHVRQLNLQAAAEELAAQLNLPGDSGPYDVLALASRRRAEGRPLVIALDGLDEAGDIECRDIAVQLVAPLSREALVLVGTRDVPGPVGEPGLLALLAPASETIDLGVDVEHTLRDVREYVARRLGGVSPNMDIDLIAEELVAVARAANPAREGAFLLARVVTSQLRADPVDTASGDWRSRLASSVEDALEADLSRCLLEIDGYEHPTAARELMRALACAYGGGFPADDVWPAVATAMSPTGTVYTRDSAYALLIALGRHIVMARERDQAVFRVAHQRLVDHLRPVVGTSPWQSLMPIVAEPAAQAIFALYERLLDGGQEADDHAYLWRFAWQHLADAGAMGIDLLRRLVERDRAAFLPDLAMGMMRVAHSLLGSGDVRDAAALLEECGAIYHDLGHPVDRAGALSQLAIARNLAGDVNGADEAADEARQLLRSVTDEPGRRATLGFTLSAQALAQVRQGLPRSGLALARESIEIFEIEAANDRDSSQMLASLYVLASNAAVGIGDLAQADELSKRALEVLERGTSDEVVLIEALVGRAQVEWLQLLGDRQGSKQGRPVAGARIAERYHRGGPTGTITDILMAEGLRIYALTLALPHALDASAPAPRQLLDEAVGMVDDMAGESCEAALALSNALLARANLGDGEDAARLADLKTAQRALRRFAVSNPTAAVQLGDLIAREVALLAEAGNDDLSRLIRRQEDAVEMLSKSTATPARLARRNAQHTLYRLLMTAGRSDEAAVVLELSVRAGRELPGTASGIYVVAGLAELAGHMASGRPLEALEFGTEALQLLQSIEGEEADLVRALVHANIGAANVTLKRWDAARGPLEHALIVLDAVPPSAIVAQLRAVVLANLTRVRLAADEIESAVDGARHAVLLIEEHGPGLIPSLLAGARLALGLALRAAGERAEAAELLDKAIADLIKPTVDREDKIGLLAEALNVAAGDAWEVVLAKLEDDPEFAQALSVLRARPPDQIAHAVEDVRRALAGAAADPARMRMIRQLVRTRRSGDPQEFDAAWRAAGEPVAEWMKIPQSLELSVLSWWNAGTWQQSREYLLNNPDVLAPTADILLEELREEGSTDMVDRHLRLRADAAAHGTDDAYAPLLSELLLLEWFESALDEEFLKQHYAELLRAEVADVLEDDIANGDVHSTVAQAILVLARRGEEHVAYRILSDRAYGATMLAPAWRSVDFERLAAVATLCREGGPIVDAPGRLATVALAIAHTVTGRPDAAGQLMRELRETAQGEAERAPLLGAVSDALAHHPEQATLLELLRALRAEPATTPSVGDDEAS